MCLKSIISTVVFIFNIICMLVGIALVALGVMYLLTYNDLTDKLPKDYAFLHSLPISTIVVGSLIILISFFGCCGIITDGPCLLTTYAIILLVLFIAQVAIGVWAFIAIKDTKDLDSKFKHEIEKIFDKEKSGSTHAMTDALQATFHCCGTNGPDFWDTTPASCCESDKNCSRNTAYTKGCVEEVTNFIKNSSKVLGIVALVLSAIEVVGAVLGLCLASSIRRKP